MLQLELSLLSESHAIGFALAARQSMSLHRGWVHPPTQPEKVIELAMTRQGPTNYGFVIHEHGSSTVAGYIEISNIVRGPFQSGYLGYYMFKGYEHRGYMKWALGAVMKTAWKKLKLHRLEANIQPGNTASIALVIGLGFASEGYSPDYLKIGGRWCDHERWAVLATAKRAAA